MNWFHLRWILESIHLNKININKAIVLQNNSRDESQSLNRLSKGWVKITNSSKRKSAAAAGAQINIPPG